MRLMNYCKSSRRSTFFLVPASSRLLRGTFELISRRPRVTNTWDRKEHSQLKCEQLVFSLSFTLLLSFASFISEGGCDLFCTRDGRREHCCPIV